ncbi:UDP-N-acetylmuramoyl-tripeptide--D-alanyl-D-alanine ligase [Bacillus sp. N1-1]|jgi:UDP-N-acetylmuramoyl-tripeptide--D-alanyl-D-alanine ligase|uniref:UDP-N-acetylmuramoyl-tripeptide--D-alanyl-D- alanine ligase n=1 Tax=Bacillus sp. N1-1 TaxID=2682541 RepID=UPI001318A610|nr:UDP-N-acetylmuramoyl-tripeptide--D-alanyl-D-alanine ligase [Bacillus sp. N1-1]QHA91704.1 UDP-N-acetylmuramoyl-tripeptide--D-alanyl-D-alanine ligase [Bacillus sp. N1-1]
MKFSSELLNKISHGPVDHELVFEGVATDTRKDCTNKLFVPIVGEVFDGHRFIDAAIVNGATGTLWDKSKPFPKDLVGKINVYEVDDTTVGFQELAKQVLKQQKPYVIGVTGSNGKTTVKDMLEAVLSPKYKTFKTQGNLNNHWGLPITVLAMPDDTDVLILEMGMSGPGEISLLTQIAQPDVAVITNIGESHLLQLGSRENIAKAKMEIAEGLKSEGVLVIDGDEPLLTPVHKNAISCGYEDQNDLQIDRIEKRENGFVFTLKNEKEPFEISLLGKHNIKNAVYSIASARKLGMTDDQIRKSLSSLTLTGMRLEKFRSSTGALIINDAYNASPTSMKAALETLAELEGFNKKIAILGDMYELGDQEEFLHQDIATAVKPSITEVITVGDKAKWIYDGMTENETQVSAVSFDNKEDAASYLSGRLDDQTAVLLKASRGLGLETILQALGKES